jgi:hypothetical protein
LTIGNFLYRVMMDQDSNILPKPAVNATINTSPDDDLLESSDEPVPIPEDQAKPDKQDGAPAQ